MEKDRINKIQEYLKEHELDAFLVLTKINRLYLSGFTGSMGAVLVTKRDAQLFVDDRYTIRAKKESALAVGKWRALRLRSGSKIGVEDKISMKEYGRMKRDYLGIKWRITSNVIENLRAIKTVREIKSITKAQNIIDRIFTIVKNGTIVGKTELQIAQWLEQTAIRQGADGMAFESIVAYGANAAAPHHKPGSRKIKKGNFLLLDFGVLVRGYHSDFTRTLFIGRPNRKQEKIYGTVLEAQRKGIVEVHSGRPAWHVDRAARGVIVKAGFGRDFTHNTGHGVGLEIHELPNFSTQSSDILMENMVVTVEPGIYQEHWGGVRIEDMVLVGRKGPELLSRAPKDLESMIIK